LRRNESKSQEKKRRLEEEKAIAKIKSSKSFQKRRKGYDSDDPNEDEDAREIYERSMVALPAQTENCEICGIRFTVTAYSRAGSNRGLLCPPCTKELDDGEGFAKKKRRTAGRINRRAIASRQLDGTYRLGAKNLMTLCIETLAKNVDFAESLGDLPDKLVKPLAAILAKKRLISSTNVDLFLKTDSDSITVYEGAKLSSNDFIRFFQTVTQLKHLQTRNAIQFKNTVMDYLIGCPIALETFNIHGANLIDDEHWNSYLMKKGKHLRTLKVYHTDGHFGDDQLKQLVTSSPDLSCLKVAHNQKVTAAGLEEIANLSNLQQLTVQLYLQPKSVEDAEAIALNRCYTKILTDIGSGLKKFSLTNILFLDDEVLKALHENCTKLYKLRLSLNQTFTDEGFKHLFTEWRNPALRYIDLSKCREVEAANPRDNPDNIGLCSGGFEAMMSHSAKNLRVLKIHACRHISTASFEKVFAIDKVYPELEDVDVSFCWGVNDYVVGSIFRSCPKLKKLNIFGNFGVREVKVPKGKILIGMPNAMGMEICGTED